MQRQIDSNSPLMAVAPACSLCDFGVVCTNEGNLPESFGENSLTVTAIDSHQSEETLGNRGDERISCRGKWSGSGVVLPLREGRRDG